eukprot:gene13343-28266_t
MKSCTQASSVTLDRDSFSSVLNLIALRIPPKMCTDYMNTFKEYILHLPKMKRIYDSPNEPNIRLLLLKENITDLNLLNLPQELIEYHSSHGDKLKLTQKFELNINYEYLGVDEVLKKILPKDVEVPCSFEQAGHIAHLNIRDELLPYKYIIGEVIMDKNPSVKTVVNKIGNIETEFRTFPMEVIAGVEDFNITVKESGAILNFNFKDVYWNSRLQMEHQRLVKIISDSNNNNNSKVNRDNNCNNNTKINNRNNSSSSNQNESISNKPTATGSSTSATTTTSAKKTIVVADMMAGVGPFAIPLAKNNYNCVVHAN